MNNLCLICETYTYESCLDIAFKLSYLGTDDQIILPVISDLRIIQKIIQKNSIPVFYDHPWPCRSISLKSLKKLSNNRTRLIFTDFNNFKNIDNLLLFSLKKDIPLLINGSFFERDKNKIKTLFNSKNSENTIIISKFKNNQFFIFFGTSFIKHSNSILTEESLINNFENVKLPLNIVCNLKKDYINNFLDSIPVKSHIKNIEYSEHDFYHKIEKKIALFLKKRDMESFFEIGFDSNRKKNKLTLSLKILIKNTNSHKKILEELSINFNKNNFKLVNANPVFKNTYIQKRYLINEKYFKQINTFIDKCFFLKISTNLD